MVRNIDESKVDGRKLQLAQALSRRVDELNFWLSYRVPKNLVHRPARELKYLHATDQPSSNS